MKKLKICKCGHERKDHKGGFSWNSECNFCRCFSYNDRNRNKENLAYILTYSGFMVFQLFIVLSLLSGTRNELAEKAASITVGSINMIISGIIAITLVYTATFIVIPKITEYKRKIYPIQDTTKNENP